MNNSIHEVVERLAGDIPGAYLYVFDGEMENFIFQSEPNQQLENTILKLNRERSLASLVEETSNNLVTLDCDDTDRKFFIKKLASNLFFGLCVKQSPELIRKAKMVMSTSFS